MTAFNPDTDTVEHAPQPDYARGLAWTMGFNALMKVVVGLVAIYIARVLPIGVMGMFGLLGNIYIFAEQMREAGLKQAFYNDNQITPVRFRTYARLSVLSGLTFGLILASLSYPLANFFGYPNLVWAVVWAAVSTFLNGLSVIPMAALHKAGRFRDVGLIETGANFASVAVSLTLVLMGWGLEALVAQLVVRSALTFTLAYWQKPYSVFGHDREAARGIMKVCTPLVATDVLWLFYSLLDQFAITKLLGMTSTKAVAADANGLYMQGRKLLSIPADFIFFPLFRTVAVAIGNRSADAAHLARTFMKAICLNVLLLVSMFGASAALAKPLVLAVYTNKYAGAIPILGIICLSEAFKLTGSFAGSALVAAGKSKIPLYAWLLPYPIFAAGIALSWSHMSLQSIAWSYAAGMIAVNLVVVSSAFKHLQVERRQLMRFFECLGIAAVTTLIAYGFSLIPLKPWPHILLSLAIIPIVHMLLIGTVFARNPFAYTSRTGLKQLRESL